MSIVVDSSVWIDFFNGRATPEVIRLDGHLGQARIIVGDLVLCEVLRGFRDQRHARRADELLSLCEPAIFGGERVARAGAMFHGDLRAHGISPRKTVDLLIGTWCLLHRLPLLHSDRDFRPLVEHLGPEEA